MRRWLLFLVLLPIPFAVGLAFFLSTEAASSSSTADVSCLNLALAALALIGNVTVLTLANLRFRRRDHKK